MKKEMIRTIVLVAALWTAGGCASAPTGGAILSAADATSMIKVTVTPANADSLVAAVNPEAE
ncbi:MAG: hypothetical protein QNJ14_04495 [Woeseiaceae bacterium]|nr:hypothetical protein [Woeseiaceae bacterium]